MKKALVIGEDTRSFLSVIRSLGRMGLSVDVICFDNTSPALLSKYIQKSWNFNYQSSSSADWLENVVKTINTHRYDLVFPCDERAIFPLLIAKENINSHSKLALPNKEVRNALFDKHLTKKIATQEGVRVAKGDLIRISETTYLQLSRQFSSKFVIKPTESFNEDKLSTRNKVAIISNESDYEIYKSEYVKEPSLFLIEEYFEGTGEGVSLFACRGEVQYLFAHTRVNEPRSGGGSSYRKAIPLDQTMIKACVDICRATLYDGVGMFEFKKNYSTGEWILIEINARFWGSLPLAIHAGVDFPRYYAEYLLGTYEPKKEPVINYKLSTYARSFTSDMYDLRSEMQLVKAESGAIKSIICTISRIASFRRLLSGEKIDSFDWEDKRPFKEEFSQLFNDTIALKLKKLFRISNSGSGEIQRLLRSLYVNEGDGKLLFVCYGNIMRSPLAEKFTKLIVDNTQLKFNVESYGFHQNEGRRSPDVCVSMANELGIDLSNHSSSWLQQKHIGDRDIIFVFDRKNELLLTKYYQAKYVFNLASFIPEGMGVHFEIKDPYGKGDEATRQCYQLIIEAIKNVLEHYLMLLPVTENRKGTIIEQ